jgi:hypothetical protein
MALTIDEKREIVNLIRGEVNEMFHRHYDKYHSPENERLKQEIDDIKTNSRLYNTAIHHDIEGWKQDAYKWRNLSNGAESMGFSLEQAMEWNEKAKKWDEYGALDDSYNEIVEDAKKWRSFGMFVTLKEVEEMKQDAYKWREFQKEKERIENISTGAKERLWLLWKEKAERLDELEEKFGKDMFVTKKSVGEQMYADAECWHLHVKKVEKAEADTLQELRDWLAKQRDKNK